MKSLLLPIFGILIISANASALTSSLKQDEPIMITPRKDFCTYDHNRTPLTQETAYSLSTCDGLEEAGAEFVSLTLIAESEQCDLDEAYKEIHGSNAIYEGPFDQVIAVMEETLWDLWGIARELGDTQVDEYNIDACEDYMQQIQTMTERFENELYEGSKAAWEDL